jgi:hypothetical protein
MVYDATSRKRLEDATILDTDLCKMLINKKMRNKQYAVKGQFSKHTCVFSPSRIRRIISSSDKKPAVISIPNPDQELNPIYEGRYKKYLDFILKTSFSYKIYGQMD